MKLTIAIGALAALALTGGTAGDPATAVSPQGMTQEQLQAHLEQTRPGPEHERLGLLAGEWSVGLMPPGSERPSATGEARAEAILGGRFVDVNLALGEGAAATELRFTLGFDRRHGEWSLILMDTAGTYAVTARGPEADGLIRMRGADDDPYMESLGLEKEYAFDLELGEERFAIVLHFVDTRIEARPLLEAYRYEFTR